MSKHIDAISNGMGGQSVWMIVMAGRNQIKTKSGKPIRLSISADTGAENDCLWNTGERTSAKEYFDRVIKPLAKHYGIEAIFIRAKDGEGKELPPLFSTLAPNTPTNIPFFGDKGGRVMQGCTDKYKIRAFRQELRQRGAITATAYLGITMDEIHRMKNSDVKWCDIAYPLIDARLYRATIQEELERANIPYLLSTECDFCPHQDLARWERKSEATLIKAAEIETLVGGGYYLTSTRLPLPEALDYMRSRRPEHTLFDVCDSGYCFT